MVTRLSVFLVAFAAVALAAEGPIRGVWLTSVGTKALDSRENIRAAVQLAAASNLNTIFVVVWNSGYTLYPSRVMESRFGTPIDPKYAGRDVLREVIEEAANVDASLAVHAWFEYGFAAYYEGAPHNAAILQKYPQWAAKNYTGGDLVKNGFHWLDALSTDVQTFVASLLLEVATQYAVAGVQGDDRLPALPSEGGYNAQTVETYKAQFGRAPPSDYKDAQWVQWRANQLTTYLAWLRRRLADEAPHVVLTLAPSIYPFSLEEYLQDWPEWHSLGLAEYFFPQDYRYDIGPYRAELDKMVQQAHGDTTHVLPGILLDVGDVICGCEYTLTESQVGGAHRYVANDTFLTQMVTANRERGYKGEVFFYNEGLVSRQNFFQTVYPTITGSRTSKRMRANSLRDN